MAKREITCVNHKDSNKKEHTGITSVGGSWAGSPSTTSQVVKDIDDAVHSYFVTGTDGSTANVITKGKAPNKYISSTPDDSKKDNLLAKDACK